jgi:Na+-transporting NADH:ubiquinone oxidoreductase subunit F
MIKIFNSKVLEARDLTADVKSLKLSVPDDFEFKAGQYLSLSVIREDGKKIRKPLSIANPEEKGIIEFCIKIIPKGLASEFVKTLKAEEEVELFGPAGRFVVNDSDKDLIFIASGVGIAPFMSMIPDLLKRGFRKKITLLKSARNEKESLYDSKLNELREQNSNFEFYNIFSHPIAKKQNQGYVQDFLEKYIPDNFNGNFYICGLNEMIEDVKRKLLSLGFKEEQMFNEKFD